MAGIIICTGLIGLCFNSLLGLAIFVLGILCLVYLGGEVFTEQLDKFGKEVSWKDLIVIVIGNILGVYIMSLLINWSGIDTTEIRNTVLSHLNLSLGNIFTGSIISGVLLGLFRKKSISIVFAGIIIIVANFVYPIYEIAFLCISRIISWRLVLIVALSIIGNFIGGIIGKLTTTDLNQQKP